MLEQYREYPYTETERARNHGIQGTSITKVTIAAKATTLTVVTAVTKYDSKLTTVTMVTGVTKVIITTRRTWVNLLIKLTIVNNN